MATPRPALGRRRRAASARGLFEAASHKIPKEHPLRALYLHQPPRAGVALTRV